MVENDDEQPLQGGAINTVVRVGDTVRRAPPPNSDFVHSLLQHFEAAGWDGAPRFLGVDAQGREILTYVAGDADWDRANAPPQTDALLVQAGRLTRAFHDLTAGSALAGAEEVVCHNDLSPRNAVCRGTGDGRTLVAFIDWDNAAPGRRIHDVAHLCWQFVELGPDRKDAADAARRVRLIADAYRLGEARRDLVDTILWWQDRCWRGIEAGAEAGDAALITLRGRGGVSAVQAAFQWTQEHRRLFEAALA